MFSIHSKIEAAYSNPNSSLFQFICFIRKYPKALPFGIMMIFIIPPMIMLIKSYIEVNHILKNIENDKINFNHQQNKYDSIINKAKNQNSQENNLTEINSNIQILAEKHQLTIESLQWNLEQGKTIELSIIGNSRSLFDFIHSVKQIPYLKYNAISLIKSRQDRKVEMNTTLVILANKE